MKPEIGNLQQHTNAVQAVSVKPPSSRWLRTVSLLGIVPDVVQSIWAVGIEPHESGQKRRWPPHAQPCRQAKAAHSASALAIPLQLFRLELWPALAGRCVQEAANRQFARRRFSKYHMRRCPACQPLRAAVIGCRTPDKSHMGCRDRQRQVMEACSSVQHRMICSSASSRCWNRAHPGTGRSGRFPTACAPCSPHRTPAGWSGAGGRLASPLPAPKSLHGTGTITVEIKIQRLDTGLWRCSMHLPV